MSKKSVISRVTIFACPRAILCTLLLVSCVHVAEAKPPLKLKLKNIIFDLGGVIVDLEAERFRRRMAPISKLDNPRLRALVERFERGEETIKGFRGGLRTLSSRAAKMSDRQLDEAWGSQIGEVDCRKLRLVRRLRAQGIKTYVLSTNNPLHARIVRERFRKCMPKLKGDPIANLFSKVFFTFDVRLLKPDLKIYRHVLKRAGIKPQETLFLDDSPQNVLAAQQVGIYALLIDDSSYLNWLAALFTHFKTP